MGSSPRSEPLREQILAAATDITNTAGWDAVTMARLAERVGVSRQTVYNEVGTKPALAQAMVTAEALTFMAAMEEGFRRHPTDRRRALRRAIERILLDAENNQLLKALVTSAHGGNTDLLPLLTTDNDALLGLAGAATAEFLRRYGTPDDVRTRQIADALIRTVLSYALRAGERPATTAAVLADVYDAALPRL